MLSASTVANISFPAFKIHRKVSSVKVMKSASSTTIVGISILLGFVATSWADDRPNFVIIMVDDMGYGDAGCYGGTEFPTPNIDRLSAEGIRFTDFHSNGCVCSPTRAALLTGRYQQRAGVDEVIFAAFNRNRHHGLQRQETTFAELLSEAGYATAITGKWHLGYKEQYNPIHQGFDRFVGYVSGNVDFHSHIDGSGVFDWWHQNEHHHETGYTTHLITRHACDFIKAQSSDKPFCLYIAHEAPHDPYQGPGDKPVRKEGQSKVLWNHREPQHAKRAYREMMIEMDKGVGEVLATLKRTEQDENTLVLFFSDNGATGPGSTGGLRGRKGSLWEGGHRVPGIARWPNRIKAGSVTHQLAMTLDIMPTLLDLASVTAPPGLILDGQSLAAVLLNGDTIDNRRLFWKYGDAVCMRDGHWKLIINGGDGRRQNPNKRQQRPAEASNDRRLALFDLAKDPTEAHNLASEHPQRVTRMQNDIPFWELAVGVNATQQPNRSDNPR